MIEPSVVDGIRKNAKVFQAIIDIADEMEKIGGLENAGREAETRLSALRNTEQNLSSELQSLREDIAKMSGDKAEHLERIEGLMQEAQNRAGEVISAAKAEASEIHRKAKTDGEKILAELNAEAEKIAAKNNDAIAELDTTLSSVTAAKKELAGLQSAIEAIKSKFA